MARKTIVIDDLDGSEDAREVTFSLDGETWRIDLAEHNRQRLRAALGEFIEAGVKVGGARLLSTSGRSGAASSSAGETGAIREWARANGYDVNDRGRVPAAIVEAYEAATG
ncbi:Lsr2 family protein [Blastococcus sp. Marseille-P5729]|uniref:histone-like nucleoid-structuring protein Lsr2 n=1 Tax=Blastococcus sp. Marseille-P5729 TaxID=2086582 RepID=UPI000D1058D7|nr:Lsr2 family protein [Blastococcus sp. Marseille-P5729]